MKEASDRLKRSGRPRLDPTDVSARISVTLPARDYDRLCRGAQRADVSLAEMIRRHLITKRATE